MYVLGSMLWTPNGHLTITFYYTLGKGGVRERHLARESYIVDL